MSYTEKTHPTRSEWAQKAEDPDLEDDLGYELDNWEMVEARNAEGEQLMFLPNDEEMIKDEAFIVAEPDAVCDLVESV
ncbi:hypothetical protein [Halostella sp. PRR32]|uniref:hypothetical protein n=1 Tax=Halostella sp. PRR32 TaxID=3098147 RepID=UPI00110E1EBC|nr:hypothetical protein [Halostella sp. PRR32]